MMQHNDVRYVDPNDSQWFMIGQITVMNHPAGLYRERLERYALMRIGRYRRTADSNLLLSDMLMPAPNATSWLL